MTGQVSPLFEEERDIPLSGYPVFEAFSNLDATRSIGMQASMITYQDMQAYSTLVRPLAPWEVDVIRALDSAVLEARNELER